MDLKLQGGDLAIENDDLVLVDGLEAIRQDLDIRLKFFQGEWFLDTRVGIPYYQRILGAKPRIPALTAIFHDAILATPGVIGISDLNLDYVGAERKLTVSFVAQTTEGEIEYTKELVLS